MYSDSYMTNQNNYVKHKQTRYGILVVVGGGGGGLPFIKVIEVTTVCVSKSSVFKSNKTTVKVILVTFTNN